MVWPVQGCRQEEPAPPFNYNLAGEGERPLLPRVMGSYDPRLRGPVNPREETQPFAAEAAGPAAPALGSDEDPQAVLAVLGRFDRLIADKEYEQISTLYLAVQREPAERYWEVFGEVAEVLQEAVAALTSAAGSQPPETAARIEPLTARIAVALTRKLAPRGVQVRGEEALAVIEPPAVPGLTVPESTELRLRRAEGEWFFDVAALAAEADPSAWLTSLEEARDAVDEAVGQFQDGELSMDDFLGRLSGVLDRLLGVAGEPPPGEQQPGPPPEERQPEEPPSTPIM